MDKVPRLRLVEAEIILGLYEYAAMSHCWGGVPGSNYRRTTVINLQQRLISRLSLVHSARPLLSRKHLIYRISGLTLSVLSKIVLKTGQRNQQMDDTNAF